MKHKYTSDAKLYATFYKKKQRKTRRYGFEVLRESEIAKVFFQRCKTLFTLQMNKLKTLEKEMVRKKIKIYVNNNIMRNTVIFDETNRTVVL